MDIIEKFTSLLDGFDIAGMIPNVDDLMNMLEPAVRLLILVGPIAMLVLGLYYFFASPKEANYSAGYRFRYAMSRVEVWQFTQRIAGMAFGSVGLILTLIMAILSAKLGSMAPPDMVWFALKCLLWELVPAIIITLGVNILVIILFDAKGNPRSMMKKQK